MRVNSNLSLQQAWCPASYESAKNQLLAKTEIDDNPPDPIQVSGQNLCFLQANFMTANQHIIILPYFCDEEVNRYLKIADRLRTFPQPEGGYRFLLASSPRTQTSTKLVEAYSSLGTTIAFSCPTQVFGYPEGPTAMFWDCMDFIAERFPNDDGFSLWMESDMFPVQPDWIDRLSNQWFGENETPIMMGCFVPEVYKHRLFKKSKLILQPHINGGACYAKDFAKRMPAAARQGVFDMAVYEYAQKLGRAKSTRQIAFSTMSRVRRDLLDTSKVLLHGFMQPKDLFIDRCLQPLTESEKKAAVWNPLLDQLEQVRRQIRVKFVRKGHRAMLENMFLAKQRFERLENARIEEINSPNPWSPSTAHQVA